MPPSSKPSQPSDLELAALVASKVCHDIINPVGAMLNGLEMLAEDDDDPKARAYGMTMLRNVTDQASARLKFARLAFGASQASGDQIDLRAAEDVARELLGSEPKVKHTIKWQAPVGFMGKDHIKLLLNMVTLGIAALPRGGEVDVSVGANLTKPTFLLRCRGNGARLPQHLPEIMSPGQPAPVTSMNVQPYFTVRIANAVGARFEVVKDGDDIVLSARS